MSGIPEDYTKVVRATVTCTVVLAVKMIISNYSVGFARAKAGTRAPEDTYQDRLKPRTEEKQKAADDRLRRAERVVMNDLENIPLTLFIAIASLVPLTAVDNDYNLAQLILICVFTGARVGHTFAYFAAWSYTRSLFYFFGLLSTIGLGINAVIAAFEYDA